MSFGIKLLSTQSCTFMFLSDFQLLYCFKSNLYVFVWFSIIVLLQIKVCITSWFITYNALKLL